MGGGGKSDRAAATERRSCLVLLAAFALIIQLMIPSAVMAAQTAASGEIICTSYGLDLVRSDAGAPEKGFAGLPCQNCLGPASAALPAPPLAMLPVAYAVARVTHTDRARPWAAPARAPPRPPGQGPPVPNV